MFIQKLLKTFVLYLLVCAGSGFSDAVIRHIAEVRALSPAVAAQGLAVEVEGQILWRHPKLFGAFVLDGKTGVFVSTPEGSPLLKTCRPGDRVRVCGTTAAGSYNPNIVVRSIEVLRHEPLPVPRPFQQAEIQLSLVDCDWVSVRGRLISVKKLAEYRSLMLVLDMQGHQVDVQVVHSPGAFERACDLLQQDVKINAVAGVLFNSQRQMTGRIFYANSVEAVVPVIPRNTGLPAPLCAIQDLQRGSFDYRQMVKTRGWVTYADGGDTFLRGDGASLKVRMQNSHHVHVGDYVETVGYVWPQRISPAFRARSIQVLERKERPAPVRMNLEAPLTSEMDYELVEVEVVLVDVGKTFGKEASELASLLCRAGTYSFETRLPSDMDVSSLKPGSKLRLTGICHLTLNPKISYRLDFDGFWLLLQDADGIELLQAPSWWTATRLVWLLGIVLVVLAVVLLWVFLLRKTVEKQTGIIQDKVAHETIHQERQRIARELHDSLSQGLAGIALQLKGCLKRIDVRTQNRQSWLQNTSGLIKNEDLKHQFEDQRKQDLQDDTQMKNSIEVIQNTLAYCSAESRNMIFDLRGGLLERMDLPAAIQEALLPLVEECGAKLTVTVSGERRRLKQTAERNLLLIAKEAATNAARHASPAHISVDLQYAAESFALTVRDDGGGFVPDQLPMIGHFGLRGMRERIKKMGGRLTVQSVPGQGTSVAAELSPLEKWELEQK